MTEEKYSYQDISKREAETLLEKMNALYHTGRTRNTDFRKMMLRKLKKNIKKYEKEIENALYKDLGKSPAEAYITDIGMVYQNIDYFISNLESFSKKKAVKRQPHGAIC